MDPGVRFLLLVGGGGGGGVVAVLLVFLLLKRGRARERELLSPQSKGGSCKNYA